MVGWCSMGTFNDPWTNKEIVGQLLISCTSHGIRRSLNYLNLSLFTTTLVAWSYGAGMAAGGLTKVAMGPFLTHKVGSFTISNHPFWNGKTLYITLLYVYSYSSKPPAKHTLESVPHEANLHHQLREAPRTPLAACGGAKMVWLAGEKCSDLGISSPYPLPSFNQTLPVWLA